MMVLMGVSNDHEGLKWPCVLSVICLQLLTVCSQSLFSKFVHSSEKQDILGQYNHSDRLGVARMQGA